MNIGSQMPASVSQSDPLKQSVDISLMRKTRDLMEGQATQLLQGLPQAKQDAVAHPYLGQRIDIRY